MKPYFLSILILSVIVPQVAADPTFKAVGTTGVLSTTQAIPVTTRFFLSPGADPTGAQRWEAAIGRGFTELSLDNFSHLQTLERLNVGNVTIRLSTNQASQGQIVVSPEFAYPGSVYHGALRNGNSDAGSLASKLRFNFSNPVSGFGLWIFDDNRDLRDSFRMIVEDADGRIWTSRVLESGNGFDPAVEGFIGVQSSVGIRRAVIQAGYWNGSVFQLHQTDFYVDSLRCVVPAPTAVLLGTLGLALTGRIKRRI